MVLSHGSKGVDAYLPCNLRVHSNRLWYKRGSLRNNLVVACFPVFGEIRNIQYPFPSKFKELRKMQCVLLYVPRLGSNPVVDKVNPIEDKPDFQFEGYNP